MSLEEALNRNSDLLEIHNDLLTRVLAAAGNAKPTAETETAAAKPKATRGKNKDKPPEEGSTEDDTATTGTTGGITFDGLKSELGAWLGEFAKAEDKKNPDGTHPEVLARKEALKKAFASGKIGITQLPEIAEDAEKIKILHDWLNNTAKKADNGFGIGRLAADPTEAEEPAEEEDDMGI